MRRIAVFTGSRAEYGLLYPLIKQINEHNTLVCDLIVSGGHFVAGLGGSYDEIKNDGVKIACTIKPAKGASVAAQCAQVYKGVDRYIQANKPDFFVVLGDRHESFAAAGAAFCAGCVLVHIAGGDTTQGGMRDDSFRHAISKLAHIHLPFTKKSAQNLKALGEQPWRIKCYGSPAVDNFLRIKKSDLLKTLRKKHSIPTQKPYVLLTQHPVTGCENKAAKHMRTTLKAVEKAGVFCVVTAPNHDSGWEGIVEVIEEFKAKKGFTVVKNLGRDDYLGLMLGAGAVVGNSSSGVLESPIAKVPAVNIGKRQSGRGFAANIISVDHKQKEITEAVKKAVFDEAFIKKTKALKHVFGQGRSAKHTANLLAGIELGAKLLNKKHIFTSRT